MEKQGTNDVGVQNQQHEPSMLTEKQGINDISDQNQQLESQASTLPEGPPLQRWNHPRINVGRSLVAFYGLVIMGANDAAYGVSRRRSH